MFENAKQRYQYTMLQSPIIDKDYYVIALLADEDGNIFYSYQTHWVGFAEGKPKFEKRHITVVDPVHMKSVLTQIGQPPVIVNNMSDLRIFYLFGGNAIIISEIAKTCFTVLFDVNTSAPIGSTPGYINVNSIPKSKLKSRPSKIEKTKIRRRDNYSCLLCGKTGDKLTFHHITPKEWGGLTSLDNLISLCTECHSELHEKYGNKRGMFDELYEKIGYNKYDFDINNRIYHNGVINYQKKIIHLLEVYFEKVSDIM